MSPQTYGVLSIVGVALALVGGAMVEGLGSAGAVPPEDWLGSANFADVLGGLLCGGGLLVAVVGVYGFRNG